MMPSKAIPGRPDPDQIYRRFSARDWWRFFDEVTGGAVLHQPGDQDCPFCHAASALGIFPAGRLAPPSFSCLACERSGDVVDFIAEYQGFVMEPRTDGLDYLGRWAGVHDLPEVAANVVPLRNGNGDPWERPEEEAQPRGPLVLTAQQFIDGFTPPAYLVTGVMQRGYLYSLTARTSHGKTAVALYVAQCVARGVTMHDRAVKAGTVLVLAGENPDDIRARYLIMADAYGFDPEKLAMRFIAGVVSIADRLDEIRAAAEAIGDLMLVVVDTAAAYFPGDETNSNAQQAAYARLLRQLTFLRGKPAVLACCHPVKNAARDNLTPMGGSAFLNEVDGNLTLWANSERQTILHWQAKFRGLEFDPLAFELLGATSERVKDTDGTLMPSVVAKPISESTLEASEEVAEKDEDKLLETIHRNPNNSFAELGRKMGCSKIRVQRLMERLREDKLVQKRRNNKYSLTVAGKKEIGVGKGGEDE
jgi:hypothetical protein